MKLEKINSKETRKFFLRAVVLLDVIYLFIYFTLPLFGYPIETAVLTTLYNMFIAIAITSALAEAKVTGVMPIVESSLNRIRGLRKTKKVEQQVEEDQETISNLETVENANNLPKTGGGVNLFDKFKRYFVGLTEFEGLSHNPRIIEIFKYLGWFDYYQMKTDEHSWCASLPAYILKKAGISSSVTKPNAAAKSFLKIGEVLTVNEAEKILRLTGYHEDFLIVAVFHAPNRGPKAGHIIMLKSIHNGIAEYGAGNESNQFKEGKRSLLRSDLAGIRLISKSNF